VERTVFCMLRKCVTTLRLRSDRFTVCRARLAADLYWPLVIIKNLVDVHARERIAIVKAEVSRLRIGRTPHDQGSTWMPVRALNLISKSFALDNRNALASVHVTRFLIITNGNTKSAVNALGRQ